MTGLRAKQKADRNRRILQAATELFREVGYDSARIEDIAERAEVSVGTFYNYYQNKGDILVAAVSMEVEEVLAAGKTIVDNPPDTVGNALTATSPVASAVCEETTSLTCLETVFISDSFSVMAGMSASESSAVFLPRPSATRPIIGK